MATIVVLEPTPVTLPHLKHAVESLRHRCVFVVSRDHYEPGLYPYLDEVECIEADTSSAKEVVNALCRRPELEIAGVTTTADRFLRASREVADALSTRGPDPCLLEYSSKAGAYRASPDSFPATVLFEPRAIPFELLADKLRTQGPFVCKPSRAAGADGIFMVSTPSDVTSLAELIDNRFYTQEWIAQSAVDGTLLSLEGYVIAARMHVLGLSIRRRFGFSEVTNEFPREGTRVGEDVEWTIVDLQKRFLAATGFRNGYFHSEYILAADQRAFLIDPNLGRVGGGGIFHQIATSFAVAPEAILSHVMDVTLFAESSIDGRVLYGRRPLPSIFVQYGLQASGTLLQLNLPAERNGVFHTQIAKIGAHLREHGRNNRSQIGIAAGERAAVKKFIEATTIVTESGVKSPFYGDVCL